MAEDPPPTGARQIRRIEGDAGVLVSTIADWLAAHGVAAGPPPHAEDGATRVAGDGPCVVLDLRLGVAMGHDVQRDACLTATLRLVLPTGQRLWAGDAVGPDDAPRMCVGDLRIDVAARTVRRGGTLVDVTSVEFDLLRLLAAQAGRTVTRDALSSEGLGRPFDPADRSIDMHVSKLRRKLGPHPCGCPRIRTVRGVGYVYTPAAG